MPCRCDGYDVSPAAEVRAKAQRKMAAHEHQVRCNAQSLAHKLGKILEAQGIEIPEELNKKLGQHRRSLLSHKKEEREKDIKATEKKLAALRADCHKIVQLGGEPTEAKKEELAGLTAWLQVQKNQTDGELLG